MSIFSETVKKSIGIYRQMLRKYLPQAERVNKLNELNLKNSQLYENEIALYHTAHAVVADIEKNLNKSNSGYYSYSGVSNFSKHLKTFLDNYEIENTEVIHRSQRASQALIQAIQMLCLPREKLTKEIAEKLSQCNEVIAHFGTDEQRELHKTTLQSTILKEQEQNTTFYRSILHNFQQQVQEVAAEG